MDDGKATELFTAFNVTCKKCGSSNIEFEDSRGYSETSGGWGSLDLKCVDCGNYQELISN